jgi:hypothetical protein
VSGEVRQSDLSSRFTAHIGSPIVSSQQFIFNLHSINSSKTLFLFAVQKERTLNVSILKRNPRSHCHPYTATKHDTKYSVGTGKEMLVRLGQFEPLLHSSMVPLDTVHYLLIHPNENP